MTLRPTADGRWEVLIDTVDGIVRLGPFSDADAADLERALREGLEQILRIRKEPSAA
jgi:hypothetical protein